LEKVSKEESQRRPKLVEDQKKEIKEINEYLKTWQSDIKHRYILHHKLRRAKEFRQN
jgi:hypothetical protein